MYEYFVGASAVSPILLVAWKQFKDKKHFSETVEKLKNLPSLLEKEKQTTEKLLGSIADSEEKVKAIEKELFDALEGSFTQERIKQFLIEHPEVIEKASIISALEQLDFPESLKQKLQHKSQIDSFGHEWVSQPITMKISFQRKIYGSSFTFHDQMHHGQYYLCKNCNLKKRHFAWPNLNNNESLLEESWNKIVNTNGWYNEENKKIDPCLCKKEK